MRSKYRGRIGIFDSGFGGLAIAKQVIKKLPQYDYVYLGDSANAPYGPKPRDEVRRLTTAAVDALFGVGCELIIIACNTSSAQALRTIQQSHLPKKWPDKRVLGVLIPAAEAAVSQGDTRIGVMATLGTVNSGSFEDEIKKLSPGAKVIQQACPELVPLIEAGDRDSDELRAAAAHYADVLRTEKVQSVVLGCTHYELIQDVIAAQLPKIKIISEGKIVAQKLARYLQRHPEIESKLTQKGTKHFFSTKGDGFNSHASYFFGGPVRAQHIQIP